jgi:hypothetical protein
MDKVFMDNASQPRAVHRTRVHQKPVSAQVQQIYNVAHGRLAPYQAVFMDSANQFLPVVELRLLGKFIELNSLFCQLTIEGDAQDPPIFNVALQMEAIHREMAETIAQLQV